MKNIKIIISVLLLSNTIFAQIHIKGNVEIDMDLGLLNCSFNLSNIPEIEDYRILLNKGMNIKYFKNTKNELINYKGHYDGKMQGEAIEYTFRSKSTTSIPNEFSIIYKGAFPIYKNEFNPFDYKGIIAFNGETLRAAEQTKWYPVIYDASNDKLLNSYTYNVTVKIKGGNTVFINGTAPKKGNVSHFISKKPYPLLLFAGSYIFVENNGDYILNTSINTENAEKVFDNIEIIKSKLSSYLNLKFTDNIYLISHKAINKRKKGSSWGFNTYPAFAFTGLDFNNLVNEQGNISKRNFKYFGHEFAHNYFGSNVSSGKLSWFWSESIADYLSYNIVEDLCDMGYLKIVLLKEIEGIKDANFISLNKIENKNEINGKYRYSLGPLLLKCFEDTFGRNKTNLVLISLLEFAKSETLTLQHFKKSAMKSGINKDKFEEFENYFIKDENFKQNIINEIKKKI
jgi:hypothetical protein